MIRSATPPIILITSLLHNSKNNFESFAKQSFQNYSWFGFERGRLEKVVYWLKLHIYRYKT
ncbi:MAG: hypothetical protein DCE90_01655 [Pseudanabaena sp.]|nr:MAG: hypothetical protein DCE90_01655 [Pseudanabaena sp.]